MTMQLILTVNAVAAILLLVALAATMRIPYRPPGPLGARVQERSEGLAATRTREASPARGRRPSRSTSRQPVADTT
jgi:hypothetical protein